MSVMIVDFLRFRFKKWVDRNLPGHPPESVILAARQDQEIDFDFENILFDWPPELSQVLGWQVTKSGVPFLGAYVGGDWEHPLVCIAYWDLDANEPARYIPRDGNVVDWERGQSYWLDESEDDYGRPAPEGVEFDADALLADIEARLSP